LKRWIKGRLHLFVAYGDVLYFLEIIYAMIALNFLAGKPVAVVAGSLCGLLLSVHIILIYQRNPVSRTIQLFMMDIHLAYAVPYFIGGILFGLGLRPLDYIFIAARACLAVFEALAFYLLTDGELSGDFPPAARS
jgi:hypothetical protein